VAENLAHNISENTHDISSRLFKTEGALDLLGYRLSIMISIASSQ
jgi:hypothetical protein